MTTIIVQKAGVSDTTYTVVDIYVTSGDRVVKGEMLFCYETSKTAIDIEAPTDGYIHFGFSKNDTIQVGQKVAVITDTEEVPKDIFEIERTFNIVDSSTQKNRFSKAATELIEKHQIDIDVFKDIPIVSSKEVVSYVRQSIANPFLELTFEESDLIVYGGGGHAKMCIELLKQEGRFNIKGIVDDNISIGEKIFEIPVIGSALNLDHFIGKGLRKAIVGVGAVLDRKVKNDIYRLLKSKSLQVPTIIHPTANIEPSVILGEGNQVMQGAIVGSDVTIGNNCIINAGCIISHDSKIGDHSHITPGAILAGGVTIGNNTVVGMGVSLFLGVRIGNNVTIPNGMAIFNDVSDNTNFKDL